MKSHNEGPRSGSLTRMAIVGFVLALVGGALGVVLASPASAHTGDLKVTAVCNPQTGNYDLTAKLTTSNVPSGVTGSSKWRVGNSNFDGTPSSATGMDRGPVSSTGNTTVTLGTWSLAGTTTGLGPWVYAYTTWSNSTKRGSDGRLLSELKGDCKKPDEPKVTICHRTASYTNPYVVITVAQSAVDGNAGNDNGQGDHYLEHRGPVFFPTIPQGTEWGDIIPPIAGVHGGYNWTAEGQAAYNNGCVVPDKKVTPASYTLTPETCTEPGKLSIPAQPVGVMVRVNNNVVTPPWSTSTPGSYSVAFSAAQYYQLTSNPSGTAVVKPVNTSRDCWVKDATASVTVSPATCDTAGTASVSGLKFATLQGVLDQMPGTHTATFKSNEGHLFANGTDTLVVSYTVPPKDTSKQCWIKDATASVVVTPGTCDTAGTASVSGLKFATLVGALDQSVGTHVATFKSEQGHLFANGSETLEVSYTVAPKDTSKACWIKDAAASVTVNPGTCDTAGSATVTGLNKATLVGTLDQSVGTHVATFKSEQGHLFANGTDTLQVSYTVPDKNLALCTPPPPPTPTCPPGSGFDSNGNGVIDYPQECDDVPPVTPDVVKPKADVKCRCLTENFGEARVTLNNKASNVPVKFRIVKAGKDRVISVKAGQVKRIGLTGLPTGSRVTVKMVKDGRSKVLASAKVPRGCKKPTPPPHTGERNALDAAP